MKFILNWTCRVKKISFKRMSFDHIESREKSDLNFGTDFYQSSQGLTHKFCYRASKAYDFKFAN